MTKSLKNNLLQKNILRSKYKEVRNLMKEAEIANLNKQIVDKTVNFIESLKFKDLNVLLYSEINNEAKCLEIAKKIVDSQNNSKIRFALPKITSSKKSEMVFTEFCIHTEIKNQGYQNTKYGLQSISDKEINWQPCICFVPLVAVTRDLKRLGYGFGFYDNYFLKNMNMLKIGIAYNCQIITEKVENIIFRDNDVKLDILITENEVIDKRQ